MKELPSDIVDGPQTPNGSLCIRVSKGIGAAMATTLSACSGGTNQNESAAAPSAAVAVH